MILSIPLILQQLQTILHISNIQYPVEMSTANLAKTPLPTNSKYDVMQLHSDIFTNIYASLRGLLSRLVKIYC